MHPKHQLLTVVYSLLSTDASSSGGCSCSWERSCRAFTQRDGASFRSSFCEGRSSILGDESICEVVRKGQVEVYNQPGPAISSAPSSVTGVPHNHSTGIGIVPVDESEIKRTSSTDHLRSGCKLRQIWTALLGYLGNSSDIIDEITRDDVSSSQSRMIVANTDAVARYDSLQAHAGFLVSDQSTQGVALILLL